MIKLYNQKEQKWYDVPTNEAPGKLSEGWVGEAGVDYPVVNPDGKTVMVPAEDLNNAFTQGYRFTTNADIDRNIEANNEQIKQQNFGDPLQAGVTEFASQGLLGIPDVLARTGEELGVKSLQGFTEARKAQRELSPNATLAGGVASLLIPGGGVVGAAAKGAKEAAVAGDVAQFGNLLIGGAGTAKEVVALKRAMDFKALAAEGVVYGLGPGITEAALGKPEDIAETLVVSGLLGGILNVASPYVVNGLRKIGEEGVSATQKMVDYAAKKTMGLAVPVNKVLGNPESSALIRDVLDLTPEARRAIADRPEFVNQIADEVKASTKAVQQETAKLTSDLQSAIKNMPKDLQETFQARLKENANNLTAALDDSYSKYRELDTSFNQMLGDLKGPAQRGGDLLTASVDAMKKLESVANPRAKLALENIKNQLDSYNLRRYEGLVDQPRGTGTLDATLSQALTEGQEVQLARTLKMDLNRTANKLYSSDSGAAKIISGLADNIDQVAFKGHPNPFVQDAARQMDSLYAPLATIRRDFLGRSGKIGAKKASGRQIERLFIDPEFRQAFDDNILSLVDHYPILNKIANEVEGSAVQADAINELKRAITGKTGDANNLSGKLSNDDLIELSQTITGIQPNYGKNRIIKDSGAKLKDLQGIQQQLAEAPNAFDKLLLLKKFQGQPVSQDIQEMSKYYTIMEKLNNFSKNSDAQTMSQRFMTRGGGLGLATGMLTGNPLTGLATMAISNAVQSNPAQVLKRLAAVEKATQVFKKTMDIAVAGASDSFVKAGSGVAIRTGLKTINDPRKEYKDKIAFLNKMQTPDQMADQISNLTGSTFTGVAPNVQTALGTQYAKTIGFLQSKMPKDPLAGKSLFYDKTGYQPPDSQISSFLRHVKAAEEPMTVLASIKDGSVSKEEVDTLKALYPQMYQRLQDSITNAIIDHGDQIPYKRRLVLGTMFSVPTDPTLDPNFINKMQASSVPGAQSGRPQGAQDSAPRGSKSLELSDDSIGMTQLDRITHK